MLELRVHTEALLLPGEMLPIELQCGADILIERQTIDSHVAVGVLVRLDWSHPAGETYITSQVKLCHLQYNFPLCSAVFKIGKCFLCLTEWKHLVDHRVNSSSIDKFRDF